MGFTKTLAGRIPGVGLMRCVFTFDEAEPYVIDVELNEETTWRISRELLSAGLSNLSGYCDVYVWPHDDWYWIGLTSPDGTLEFKLFKDEIEELVRRMDAIVPRDLQFVGINVDEWLSKIFD